MKPEKYLIVRFSSIGDIVLTSPIVRCLQLQRNAEVHFLTKKTFSSLVAHNPFIDKVFTIQRKLSEVLPFLKNENYTAIIDLHKNLRTLRLKTLLNKTTYSFDKINLEKWLVTAWNIDRLPNIHLVDRYFEGIRKLKVMNDGQGLDFFIPSEQEISPIQDFGTKKYVVIVLGATYPTKRLLNEQIISICQKIDHKIVLVGGKDVLEDAHLISQNTENVINTCGKYSLLQSASIIRQAVLVLTPDTGMMHIAAAFKKPIISVWGNTISGFGMYPYYPKGVNKNITLEVEGLSCRPCSKLGFNKCPKKHFKCIKEQKINTILTAIRQIYRNT